MVVPQILTFIITVFVCIGAHITNIQYILYWFGAEAAMTFFALALGAFVAMFTGQLLAFPVYYVVVNYLYVGCWYLINMVIESVCFGCQTIGILGNPVFVSDLLSDKQSADTVSRKQ